MSYIILLPASTPPPPPFARVGTRSTSRSGPILSHFLTNAKVGGWDILPYFHPLWLSPILHLHLNSLLHSFLQILFQYSSGYQLLKKCPGRSIPIVAEEEEGDVEDPQQDVHQQALGRGLQHNTHQLCIPAGFSQKFATNRSKQLRGRFLY